MMQWIIYLTISVFMVLAWWSNLFLDNILDTTSDLEISSFGISKEFTIYIGMNSFEMPKEDISRYNVVSRMLSKKKLIF
jgi:hypothetical protein